MSYKHCLVVGFLFAIILSSGCTKPVPRTATEIVEIFTVEYTREDKFEDIYFTCNSSLVNGKIENIFSILLSVGDFVRLGWIEVSHNNMFNPFDNTTYTWKLQSITVFEVNKTEI